MVNLPTLIILADCAPGHAEVAPDASDRYAAQHFDPIDVTVRRAMDSGLPLRFVGPARLARRARAMLHETQVTELADEAQDGTGLARTISAGVLASAQAPGWLLLPADMPMLRADTLSTLGLALRDHPLVFPTYRQQSGHPVGLSTEFFSELIRLEHDQGLDRLMARYPSVAIEVDDPGVLLSAAQYGATYRAPNSSLGGMVQARRPAR
jgi:CTP:molybdopterin cytidylyltransferase MocA